MATIRTLQYSVGMSYVLNDGASFPYSCFGVAPRDQKSLWKDTRPYIHHPDDRFKPST